MPLLLQAISSNQFLGLYSELAGMVPLALLSMWPPFLRAPFELNKYAVPHPGFLEEENATRRDAG